jgi:hypothetical protein
MTQTENQSLGGFDRFAGAALRIPVISDTQSGVFGHPESEAA